MKYIRYYRGVLLLCVFSLCCEVRAYDLLRLGSVYGGWTIPGVFDSESIVYCAGAGEDISFDIQVLTTYGCHVYIFDPTPRAIAHVESVRESVTHDVSCYTSPNRKRYVIEKVQLTKLHFFPLGLWKKECVLDFFAPRDPTHVSHSIANLQKTNQSFKAQCKNLKSLMTHLGHERIDLLKLDIEGAEYGVIEHIIQEDIPIMCLCIEFDELAGMNRVYNSDIQGTIQKIEWYLALLKWHGYEIIYHNGYTDMTLMRHDLLKEK